MPLLPIVDRELRVQARSRTTYWTRSAVALVGILICLEAMGIGQAGAPTVVGPLVFNIVLGAAFLLSCSGCLLTADTISAERRSGTLELLFLTLVKPVDVLLGKLGSVGINGVCALVAFLPVLMIPLLAGGVTGGEAIRKGLVLLNVLFLSLVIGLFSSAAEEDRSRSVRRAFLMVALVVVVPYFIFAAATRSVPHYIGLLSPLVSIITASDVRYLGSRSNFWCSLLFEQIFAWVLLAVTAIRLQLASAREIERKAARVARAAVESQLAVGLGTWEPVKGDSTPVEWLVYRKYGVSAGIWGVALLALAYSGWVSLSRDPWAGPARTMFPWIFFWPLGVTGGFIGSAMVAWISSRFFMGVRRSGDLELLMTTPLGAETIVSDQWNVLKRFFIWPVLAMQTPMVPKFLAMLSSINGGSAAASDFHRTLYELLTLVNTAMGAAALCWLAMWFGFKARTQAGAIVWTVGLATGVPALISLVFFIIGDSLCDASNLSRLSVRAPGALGIAGTFAYAAISWLPQAIILVLYCWLIGLSKHRLRSELYGAEPTPVRFDFRPYLAKTVQILKAES